MTKSAKRIVIIGAGPGGLCMAIRLKQAGFDDIVVLEKGSGVGGTWYHNRYPGCACDIQSHLYSFSFEPKYDWSRPYAPQPEILAYMETVAEKYDVLRHCRFETAVEGASWNETTATWTVRTESGETLQADVVVSAIGMFNEIAWPDIPGRDDFEGTAWHSARWNWDYDLAGKAVGVIGSAASAVQFVPEIVKTAGHVYLHQRSANWVLPKLDDPYTPEQIEKFRQSPELLRASREAIFDQVDAGCTFSDVVRVAEFETYGLAAIEQVEDPAVREHLKPLHPFGCKRPLLSNEYYPAFNRPNLDLVTDPIQQITSHAIVTEDGCAREVDAIIYATGFSATKYLSALKMTGRDGRSIDEAWREGSSAYLGITTPGFPNLFMLYGPNTNNGSILYMIECQVEYILRRLEHLPLERGAWIDVREDVVDAYNESLQKTMDGVRAWSAGCTNYYRTPTGRIVTQWPDSMRAYRDTTSASNEDPAAFRTGNASS